MAALHGAEHPGRRSTSAGRRRVQRVHRQIEAIKLGFADAHAHVADPERVAGADGRRCSIPEYAGGAAGADHRRGPATRSPATRTRGGTVYLCAADADGMMVSLIQSNYLGFGSRVVLPGYGFALQNRGAGFRLDPGHPNVVGPASGRSTRSSRAS